MSISYTTNTRPTHLFVSVDCNLLLLKVPPVLLVYENQVEVVPHGEFLVDVSECRRQLEASEEQPYWYSFT